MKEEIVTIDDEGYKFIEILENGKMIEKSGFEPDGKMMSRTEYELNEWGYYWKWKVYDSNNKLTNIYEFTFNPDRSRKDATENFNTYDGQG